MNLLFIDSAVGGGKMSTMGLNQMEAPEVTAEVDGGKAAFRRTGGSAATLEIDYDVQAQTAELPNGDLLSGVVDLCNREIDTMRQSLSGIGEALASQLSEDGKDVHITREWNNRDNRTWNDGRTSFTVDGSHSRMTENLNGFEGASDAKLVRESVGLLIEQRQENIRDVYGRILLDAYAKRGAEQPGEQN